MTYLFLLVVYQSLEQITMVHYKRGLISYFKRRLLDFYDEKTVSYNLPSREGVS